MTNQQISWDAFAAFLADVVDRHGLDMIADGGSGDVATMASFASLDCTVFYLPVVAVDGEVGPTVERLCSTQGIQFLAMKYFDEYAEALTLVRGTGDDVQQRIESLIDESDWPAISGDQTREPRQQPIENDSLSQAETATAERVTSEHISWDNFATFLVSIERRHRLDVVISDVDFETKVERVVLPIESLNCTVLFLPHANIEDEDVSDDINQLCESHGLRFASMAYIGEYCEALVVVAGTDHDTQRKVESLLDGCDVDWDAFERENKPVVA